MKVAYTGAWVVATGIIAARDGEALDYGVGILAAVAQDNVISSITVDDSLGWAAYAIKMNGLAFYIYRFVICPCCDINRPSCIDGGENRILDFIKSV